MKKTPTSKNLRKSVIQIPNGFMYLSGDKLTGCNLKIQDINSKSVYIWISVSIALKKINKFLEVVENRILEAKKSKQLALEEKYKKLLKYTESVKIELALRNGVFYKENSICTFRM